MPPWGAGALKVFVLSAGALLLVLFGWHLRGLFGEMLQSYGRSEPPDEP